MPRNLSKVGRRSKMNSSPVRSWIRLSNHLKVLSFVAIFALVGSVYLISTHAATDTTSDTTIGAGDSGVTDPDALAPETPIASDADQTDSTLVDDSSAAAATANCPKSAFTPVKSPYGATYWLNPDRYGNGTQCPGNTDGALDFSVYNGGSIQPYNGHVQAFPDLIKGCTFSACTPSSGMRFQISSMNQNLNESVHMPTTGAPDTGIWDSAIDIWINRNNVVGPSAGAEILIMLNHQRKGPPQGAQVLTNIPIDGASWDVYYYRQSATISGKKFTWNFIEYRRNTTTQAVSALNLAHFIDDAEGTYRCVPNTNDPCVYPSWTVMGIDTGFELWFEGRGLQASGLGISN